MNRTHLSRLIALLCVCAALLGPVAPASATASSMCDETAILNDARDHAVGGNYPLHCLQGVLVNHPADDLGAVKVTIEDAIKTLQQPALASTDAALGDGRSPQSIGPAVALPLIPSKSPLESTFAFLAPASVADVPTPIVAMGLFAGLLLTAGLLSTITRSRVRRRSNVPLSHP